MQILKPYYKVYLHEFHCLLITECPIKGQIYYPRCAPCDTTCENPNVTGCLPICRPGCACPPGKVIKNGRRCVKPEKCGKGEFKCDSLCMFVHMYAGITCTYCTLCFKT